MLPLAYAEVPCGVLSHRHPSRDTIHAARGSSTSLLRDPRSRPAHSGSAGQSRQWESLLLRRPAKATPLIPQKAVPLGAMWKQEFHGPWRRGTCASPPNQSWMDRGQLAQSSSSDVGRPGQGGRLRATSCHCCARAQGDDKKKIPEKPAPKHLAVPESRSQISWSLPRPLPSLWPDGKKFQVSLRGSIPGSKTPGHAED